MPSMPGLVEFPIVSLSESRGRNLKAYLTVTGRHSLAEHGHTAKTRRARQNQRCFILTGHYPAATVARSAGPVGVRG